ncbi:hypothetical protein DERP_007895 [Dermatophagoides pteronyssinus]|uniref:Uncharacterized protein n=1 Tax=Dermatophagoides pteronyssinus TaxID=6956 RepID=A0ABQ8ISX8_DERPT|nr:hypothetical protein DERP_007895 [Dermatophagoides pteronyssinus]
MSNENWIKNQLFFKNLIKYLFWGEKKFSVVGGNGGGDGGGRVKQKLNTTFHLKHFILMWIFLALFVFAKDEICAAIY